MKKIILMSIFVFSFFFIHDVLAFPFIGNATINIPDKNIGVILQGDSPATKNIEFSFIGNGVSTIIDTVPYTSSTAMSISFSNVNNISQYNTLKLRLLDISTGKETAIAYVDLEDIEGFVLLENTCLDIHSPKATLHIGSSGPNVVKLQNFLKQYGYLSGSADGDFGNQTKQALISFQNQVNLTADGVFGPGTSQYIDNHCNNIPHVIHQNTGNTGNIGGTSSSIIISYLVSPHITLKQTTGNPKHWYYEIQAKFTRSQDVDVYFVVQRTKRSDNQQDYANICKIPAGGTTRNITYPNNSNTLCNNALIDSDFFNADSDYVFYISGQSKGFMALDTSDGVNLYYPDSPVPQGSQAGSINNNSQSNNGNNGNNQSNTNNNPNSSSTGNSGGTGSYSVSGSSGGYTGTVNTSNTGLVHSDCGYGGVKGFVMCGFQDGMELINRVINFIFILILPIAAIVFVYVGILYLSSAANPNKRTQAKQAMGKLVLGMVIIMFAWILIKAILHTLGVGDGYIMLDM